MASKTNRFEDRKNAWIAFHTLGAEIRENLGAEEIREMDQDDVDSLWEMEKDAEDIALIWGLDQITEDEAKGWWMRGLEGQELND